MLIRRCIILVITSVILKLQLLTGTEAGLHTVNTSVSS
jgi:hypothetical protein